jgi:guanylate kinase
MTDAVKNTGTLFVISAPSGTGKSTVARRLLEQVPGLEFSVSYTTRAPRDGERRGGDYHFVDRERFEEMRREGAFLEWASVFGNLYGTGLEATRSALAEGRDLLLDIDVQGARQVRDGPVPAVSIMILPPDYRTLRERLDGRGSERDEERAKRLAEARDEVADFGRFDYVVINENLAGTLDDLRAIVRAERLRAARQAGPAGRILATFPD